MAAAEEIPVSRPRLADCLGWTIRDWLEYHQRELVTQQVRYRGVPCWKNVMDLWVYQEILWETQVDVVIEIGVKHGGTTLWLSDTLASLRGPDALVVGVDLVKPGTPLPDNVCFLSGDSVDPAVVAAVAHLVGGRRAMVIADGNHAEQHVLAEMRAYGPLISPGCYFVAEDGIVDVMEWSQFTPGPREAALKFAAESPDFVIDESREKFILTYCPSGFLRRVA